MQNTPCSNDDKPLPFHVLISCWLAVCDSVSVSNPTFAIFETERKEKKTMSNEFINYSCLNSMNGESHLKISWP